ncbi:hypothetical protein M758_UG276700 [Ceratodon purpureus]|nr:hypothetical protein M758_UG276700 [Ceratodon purpureus]
MFLDTADCVALSSMLSMAWCCVTVTAKALQNNIMSKLQTPALLEVGKRRKLCIVIMLLCSTRHHDGITEKDLKLKRESAGRERRGGAPGLHGVRVRE